MKKLLSLLLCLLLMLTLFTACGKDSRRDDEDDDDSRPSFGNKEDDSAAIVIETSDELKVSLGDEWTTSLRLENGTYGLNQLTLSRARLNHVNSVIDRNAPLLYPVYGADGRVSELLSNTLTGAYDKREDQFVYTTESTGVSVLGQSSAVSERDFCILNGKSIVLSHRQAAANAVQDVLRNYGGQLASLVIRYQNANYAVALTDGDVAFLKTMITDLQTANGYIEQAIKAGILATLAADTDINWEYVSETINGDNDADFQELLDVVTLPDGWIDAYEDCEAVAAALEDASNVLSASGSVLWQEVEPSISNLMTVSDIRVGDYTIDAIVAAYVQDGLASDVVKDLFYKVTDGTLTFGIVGGIFTDIAALIGPCSSSMAFSTGTYASGLDLSMLGSKPTTIETSTDGRLIALADELTSLQIPNSDRNDKVFLTDVYGYILDLRLKTDDERTLILPTEGVSGNMSFTISEACSEEEIEAWASAFRMVFFDQSGTILGLACLDVDNSWIDEDIYTISLALHDYTLNESSPIDIGYSISEGEVCSLPAGETTISALVYLDGDVLPNDMNDVHIDAELSLALRAY